MLRLTSHTGNARHSRPYVVSFPAARAYGRPPLSGDGDIPDEAPEYMGVGMAGQSKLHLCCAHSNTPGIESPSEH